MNKGLISLANNHLELVNPVCPVCGSYQVTKQDYRRWHPILGEFEAWTVYLRRYQCTKCDKKFTTPLDSVVERNHRDSSVFKAKVESLTKTGYRSLRNLKEDLSTFFGIAPSHQAIKNWLGIGEVKRIKNKISTYSRYYCYDEQYIKIDGKRAYRLALFDSLLNIPATEEIAPNKRVTYRDKIELCLYFTEIKNVFRTYDVQVAIERLEVLLDEYDDIPTVLKRHIQKKILPDFNRLTLFMRAGFVSRTTNPVENYYRQTDSEQIKDKYKTSQGILSCLARKREYWTAKLGRCMQHPTG